MKATIERKPLASLLAWAVAGAERTSSMPVLNHFRLEAAQDWLTVTATNLETTFRGRVPARVDAQGVAVVPAKKLADLVKESDAERVELRQDEGRLNVALWAAGDLRPQGSYHLLTLEPDIFPETPSAAEGVDLRWDAEALAEDLNTVLATVSTDDKRFGIQAVTIQRDPAGEGLVLVSTDGHRLTELKRARRGSQLPKQTLIPREGVLSLLSLLKASGEITLRLGQHVVSLSRDEREIMVRLTTDSGYPDYAAIIGKTGDAVLTVNREAMNQALRRVALVTADRLHAATLETDTDTLRIKAASAEVGEGEELLQASCNSKEKRSMNYRYLMSACAVTKSEELQIELGDGHGPLRITGEGDPGLLIVIMPMLL